MWTINEWKLTVLFSDAREQELEQVQTGKYPSYYVALRTGRELQSLCIASDPEKTTLTEMLDELKHKWFRFKSALSEKYVSDSAISHIYSRF